MSGLSTNLHNSNFESSKKLSKFKHDCTPSKYFNFQKKTVIKLVGLKIPFIYSYPDPEP
jgi:hypothetical protein